MSEIELYKTGVTRDGSYDSLVLTGDDKSDPVIAFRQPEVALEAGTLNYVSSSLATRAASGHTHNLSDYPEEE